MPLPPLDFASWLLTQWYRHDGVGHLATAASTDTAYPRPASAEQVTRHVVETIRRTGRSQRGAVAVLEQAVAEYAHIQDHARETRLDACAVLAELARRGYTVATTPDCATNGYQLHVSGPGIVAGGEEALQRALPPDLYRRFLLSRDTIAHVLLTYHGPGKGPA